MASRNIFQSCASADALRAEYRRLSKELHPDRGGDARAFARLAEDYKTRLAEIEAEVAAMAERRKKMQKLDAVGRLLSKVSRGENCLGEIGELMPAECRGTFDTLARLLSKK